MSTEISDFEVNNLLRREMVTRRMDTGRVRFGCNGGSVTIAGVLHFTGADISPQEVPKFLYQLEQAVKGIRGVKNVKMDFEGWEKNQAGKWQASIASWKDADNKKNDDSPSISAPTNVYAPLQEPSTLDSVSPKSCPQCGFYHLKGYNFCENCGLRVKIKPAKTTIKVCPSCKYQTFSMALTSCPSCGIELVHRDLDYFIMRCGGCGNIKNKITNFCPECGKSLVIEAIPDVSDAPIKHEKVVTQDDVREMIKKSEETVVEKPKSETVPQTLKDRIRDLLDQEKAKSISNKGPGGPT
ncbi:MAG: zinc ribbon domain-containing protein [Candidatus Wallbacteria bacterium]|nr:zinc ribbon domain-containing protein [Candidatus Wallbacteria bacterium]